MRKIIQYIENLMIKDRDFEYSINIDIDTFKDYEIFIVNIDIFFKDKIFKTQPILYGHKKKLQLLSIYLWNQLSTDWIDKPIENNSCYSLKNDILIPELANKFETELGNVLDIGSYNGEILYLAQNIKNMNINKYIGVDIIDSKNIKLYPITENRRYIQQDIHDFLEINKHSFKTIVISMTLLNIIDINYFFKQISIISNIDTKIHIVDINSDSYQAKGFYYKENDEWFLKKIFNSNKIFFTLKKLSKHHHTIHCHHPKNLYNDLLKKYNFIIEYDYVKGVNKKELISQCLDEKYQKRMIKKMSKYTKYPCFHFIGVKRV